MSNHGTASIGSWVEFVSAVVRQLPRPEEIEMSVCEGWSRNQESLKKTLATALLPPVDVMIPAKPKIALALPDIDFLAAYQSYGMEAEYLSAIKTLPAWSDPNLWIVPVIASKDRKKVVTCNVVIEAERKDGIKVWTCYDDLDINITVNDRDPSRDGSYLVGFRRTVEADEENKNLSANILTVQSHKGITCLERKILGHGYFLATGQHLDVKNVTLCTCSRYRGGSVPGIYFCPDGRRVYVCWFGPGSHGVYLRSRSVQFPLPA